MINKGAEDGYHRWSFKEISAHRKIKVDGKTIMQVKVLWDTGEETWESLNHVKADDPVTVAKYAEENGLVDKPYWKWAKRYIKNKTKQTSFSHP